MIKQLEKQSEFKFMEEEREKLPSSARCATDWITAISFGGTSAIMLFYNRIPSVYETAKVYTESLF